MYNKEVIRNPGREGFELTDKQTWEKLSSCGSMIMVLV